MIDVYEAHTPAAVVAFQDVPRDEICRYGCPKLKVGTEPPELDMIVEKPTPSEAPSTLAQLGRFILPPRVIDILDRMDVGKSGELYLTDALDILCREERVLVHCIEGKWYTTGDPLRFLISNVEYALRDAEIGKYFAAYLRGLSL